MNYRKPECIVYKKNLLLITERRQILHGVQNDMFTFYRLSNSLTYNSFRAYAESRISTLSAFRPNTILSKSYH
jgi:hypothetical protein